MVCTDFDRWNYAWAWLAFSDGLFVALLLRRIRYDLRYSWDRGWKEYAQYACFINLNLIRFRIFVGTRPNQILIIIVSNRRKSVVATTRKKFPFPIFLISIAYEESATRGYWNSLSLSLEASRPRRDNETCKSGRDLVVHGDWKTRRSVPSGIMKCHITQQTDRCIAHAVLYSRGNSTRN